MARLQAQNAAELQAMRLQVAKAAKHKPATVAASRKTSM
jgi:hypothetical protein